MATSSIVSTPDGINWYVEQQGTGPHIILIPSGEGDCSSFDKVAKILSSNFTVTTFDMPGFSRTTCPPEAVENVDCPLMSKQINTLLGTLKIDKCTVYGCSSGGWGAFGLGAFYPEKVTSVIVHEVPLTVFPSVRELLPLPDNEVISRCQHMFAHFFNEDEAAWNGLGPEYHKRLEKNFITWKNGYVPTEDPFHLSNEELTKRPVTWTVGGLNEFRVWWPNVVRAKEAGIEMSLLNAKHFPHVSVPEEFAEHIKVSAEKYL
ncbi:Alpha/Beta hydrolase protein [Tricladium varicosporioides]|nr:Alpha/Beta hydrolase protein [Hymenoscyphus varicosporioides]